MNGKLIKQETHYHLAFDKEIVGSTHKIIADKYKLSLKNCQAIERGYDLDELAYEYDLDTIENVYGQVKAFKAGFQKALEILGDKKFSEEDVMLGWDAGIMSKSIVDNNWTSLIRSKKLLEHRESYQRDLKPSSLQQTEWEVEIEMECPKTGCDIECDINCYEPNKKPKLDSDGCLILKRA